MSSTALKAHWPTMSEYQEAVQSPASCFADPELLQGQPVMNKLGLPRPICGQFASVYEVEGARRLAVKCFLRNIPDQRERYARISEHLRDQPTDYFVTFEYQQAGIKVHGRPYPLVKMEWVEADALNVFIEKNLRKPRVLRGLERRWLALLDDLRTIGVGHGDLQHGNVLVLPDGNLKLIDYDGMWVPSLAGQKSHETGHPAYQSPRRTARDFDGDIDRFAGTVIRIAIRSLSLDPELWRKYDNGDNLLFQRQDYVQRSGSELIEDLHALADREIERGLESIFEPDKAARAAARPARTTKARTRPDASKRSTGAKTAKGATGPRQQPGHARKKKRRRSQAKKTRAKKNQARSRRNRGSQQAAKAAAQPQPQRAPHARSRPAPAWIEDHLAFTPRDDAGGKPASGAASASASSRLRARPRALKKAGAPHKPSRMLQLLARLWDRIAPRP